MPENSGSAIKKPKVDLAAMGRSLKAGPMVLRLCQNRCLSKPFIYRSPSFGFGIGCFTLVAASGCRRSAAGRPLSFRDSALLGFYLSLKANRSRSRLAEMDELSLLEAETFPQRFRCFV